jgi:hypothetical protein
MSGIALEAAELDEVKAGGDYLAAGWMAMMAGRFIGDGKTTSVFIPDETQETKASAASEAASRWMRAADQRRKEEALMKDALP